jgi:sugar/nucleoside kinase (ribokinase family)
MRADHPRFAVIGSLTIDSVVTADGSLIPRTCGGNALYGSIGVHIWDPSVGLVSRAGHDYPDACLGEIGGSVDIRGIRRLARDHPVRVAFVYRADGSRLRIVPAEQLELIPADVRPYFIDNTQESDTYHAGTPAPGDIPPTWLAQTPAVHLPRLLIADHVELVAALRAARPDRIVVVDSPWHERVGQATMAHLALLDRINVTMPSEEDLALLLPDMPIVDAARWLLDHGARAVVVKIGASGSLVVGQDRHVTHVPAYPAATVDPTGAGDSFCGGFLVGLLETGDLVQAALYGTVAASFVVEEAHALPVFRITREQAEARLAALQDRPVTVLTGDPRRHVT